MQKVAAENVHKTLSKWILADGFDLVFDLQRSQGSYLYDSRSNKSYLDLFSFFASHPIGYNHPHFHKKEVQEELWQAASIKPSCSDIYTTQMAEFVDAFAEATHQDHFHHYFFIEGGALAVENALKTAFDWKVRRNLARGKGEKGKQIIHFKQAFHGRSGYTLSLTNTADPNKTKYFPAFQWPRIDNPMIHFPLNEKSVMEVEKAENAALTALEKHLIDNGDDMAAIIIETIQGEGGDNHFRNEFFRSLRKLADDYDLLLIVDEVQCGMGLTGKMWAYEHFDFKPDILCFGKKSQICGFMASKRIDNVDNVFTVSSRINSTWGGNLVDMVRCRHFLHIIQEEKLIENAATLGEKMKTQLLSLSDKMDLMNNVRGRGLMLAFDLPSPAMRDEAWKQLMEDRILTLRCGAQGIRLRPALNLTQEDAQKAIASIEKTLRKL